jgi:fatty acid desaturase
MKDRTDAAHSDGRSIKQILQDIVNHVSDIIRSEVRLAKTEVQQDATHFAKAGRWIAVAAVLVFYAVGFVLLSAVYGLQGVMPSWLAALTVGVAVGMVAVTLYLTGRKKLARASLRPDKTIQTLEDNVTWFKRQAK